MRERPPTRAPSASAWHARVARAARIRATAAVFFVVALMAMVLPSAALGAISYYKTFASWPQGAYDHPTTRVWTYNEMYMTQNYPSRLWIYIPSQSAYYWDSGYTHGYLFRAAPAVATKLWCQNWAGYAYYFSCEGGY